MRRSRNVRQGVGVVRRLFVRGDWTLLHNKISCMPHGIREDGLSFSLFKSMEEFDSRGVVHFDHS